MLQVRYSRETTPIGDGTYGIVFKGSDNSQPTPTAVAIKFPKSTRASRHAGVSWVTLREIKLLKELRHEHVIELLDVYEEKRGRLSLVFELCAWDLSAMIVEKDRCFVSTQAYRHVFRMLFKGLAYLHERDIVHRDVKPNNVLFTERGVLKLIDFGSARILRNGEDRSHQVSTRWYRSPELMYGDEDYGVGLDIWAAGCTLVEALKGEAPFQGRSDIDQLMKIFGKLGTPTEADWPTMRDLPCFLEFQTMSRSGDDSELFGTTNESCVSLINCLLRFDPAQRLSANEALRSSFFEIVEDEIPVELVKPTVETKHREYVDSSDDSF